VRTLDSFDVAEIEELRRRDEFFWLELDDPTEEELERLEQVFGFHELAIEDSREFGQRPKLDDYGEYAFVVYYGAAEKGGDIELIEVHLFVSGSYVISIHRAPCEALHELREDFAKDDHVAEDVVLYRVFDRLTDSFFPVLSSMDDEIDRLEEEMVIRPTDEQLQRLFRLKRSLVELRRVVTPQRDFFARRMDDIARLPGLEISSNRDYFRDVYDHLIRISDQIDSYRDLLTGAMDVYLSTVSNRLNQVMKQLTVIATIFLPLTFVTGFFGQNFAWMVKHVDTLGAFLGFGVGGVVAALVLLFAWFRRSGYV
jgi:magnesium transporter